MLKVRIVDEDKSTDTKVKVDDEGFTDKFWSVNDGSWIGKGFNNSSCNFQGDVITNKTMRKWLFT